MSHGSGTIPLLTLQRQTGHRFLFFGPPRVLTRCHTRILRASHLVHISAPFTLVSCLPYIYTCYSRPSGPSRDKQLLDTDTVVNLRLPYPCLLTTVSDKFKFKLFTLRMRGVLHREMRMDESSARKINKKAQDSKK